MPIIKSAKKAMRSSARKRVFNERRKHTMKVAVKEAIRSTDKKGETLAAAYQAIDKAAKRGVIKKNTAARKKSRLVATLKRAQA